MNEGAANLKKASNAGMIWGILTIILGILAIGAPLVTGVAVSMLVGIVLIIGGLAQTVYAFQAPSLGRGILKFLFGGLTVLVGIAMLAQPVVGLTSLTMLLAVYFFVDGIFTLIVAWNVKPEAGWGWMTFNGVVTILLAWLIMKQWPVSGAWAIGILVGVRLLFSGITMLTLGAAGRQVAKSLND